MVIHTCHDGSDGYTNLPPFKKCPLESSLNLLKPTGYVMHQQA